RQDAATLVPWQSHGFAWSSCFLESSGVLQTVTLRPPGRKNTLVCGIVGKPRAPPENAAPTQQLAGKDAGGRISTDHRTTLTQLALRHEFPAVLALHPVNLDRAFLGQEPGAALRRASGATRQILDGGAGHARP